jgi:hypothetical protein
MLKSIQMSVVAVTLFGAALVPQDKRSAPAGCRKGGGQAADT